MSDAEATGDSHEESQGHHAGGSLATLVVGAVGVVFGDIGTSPIYAFRETFVGHHKLLVDPAHIYGVLSLIFWSMMIVVTFKYVTIIMRADNKGEGGSLALLALINRQSEGARWSTPIVLLGVFATALFYGDSMITPAMSILSASEGLAVVNSGFGPWVVPLSVGILVGLFTIQSRGTATVGSYFGPVMMIYFASIAVLGTIHIFGNPGIFWALNPYYAISFFVDEPTGAFLALGSVVLAITGAEALYADMGHFGRRPIGISWLWFVMPALMLNYLGQGAMIVSDPSAIVNPFFLLAPESIRIFLVLLAMLASIIASQAVISGAFSLTQQAIQLGLLPRIRIRQTSADFQGQIYLPTINWLLLLGVLLLVNGFRNSSDMAAAYGIAVTGTMVVTTCLAFIIVHRLWGWTLWGATLFVAPFLALDLIFFGANILRVVEGGWVPLVLAAAIGLVISIWVRGKRIVHDTQHGDSLPLDELAKVLALRPPKRVAGTAVFLTADPDVVPGALLHNLKHNKILHERNLIVTIRTRSIPHVPEAERVEREPIDANFERITLHYGFMETPDVPKDLALDCKTAATIGSPMAVSFFIGRNSLRASPTEGLPLWQDQILLFLQRNAADPTDFFQIPPNRVVELGMQVTV